MPPAGGKPRHLTNQLKQEGAMIDKKWKTDVKANGVLTRDEWVASKLYGVFYCYLGIGEYARDISGAVAEIREECQGISEDGTALLNRLSLFSKNLQEIVASRHGLFKDVYEKADKLAGEV